MATSDRWGVELNLTELDRELWTSVLQPPFDPYIEEVHGKGTPYLTVRSSAFDGLTTPSDVYAEGKRLVRRLNAAVAANAGAGPSTLAAVVEFGQAGSPKRHQFIEGQTFINHPRFYPVKVTVQDAEGNIVETPPAASKAQDWMRAAALHADVASAMEYLSDSSGWGDLYKAYEALHRSGLAKAVISRVSAIFPAR